MRSLLGGLAFTWAFPLAALAQGGPPSGTLSCTVGATVALVVTSQRPMECRYAPRRGPAQRYLGVVRTFGVDIGAIGRSTMQWRVFGPYARAPLGALNGRYTGLAAGAAISLGGSGNLLIGGPDRSVTLQPLTVQARRGINLAAGVTAFDLSVRGRRR
jgi:hypothetical protein